MSPKFIEEKFRLRSFDELLGMFINQMYRFTARKGLKMNINTSRKFLFAGYNLTKWLLLSLINPKYDNRLVGTLHSEMFLPIFFSFLNSPLKKLIIVM